MNDIESRDFHPVVIEDDAFLNVGRVYVHTVAWPFRVDLVSRIDVKCERPLQMVHHVLSPVRSPDVERRVATPGPTGKPNICKTDDMIGMQVREEEFRDVSDVQLPEV